MPFVFDRIVCEVVEWKNVIVSATQNCIVFVHKKTFLVIRPMKKQLDIKFYSQMQLEELPVMKSIAYSGKYENHIRVSELEDITQHVFILIKQSYQLL